MNKVTMYRIFLNIDVLRDIRHVNGKFNKSKRCPDKIDSD